MTNPEQHRGEKLIGAPTSILGDSSIIPLARDGEIYPITLTLFQDHGRPAFITSTIRSSRVLVEVASELTTEESQRITTGAGKILEEILDGHPVIGTTVFSHTEKARPNIYVASFGDPYSPTGLRLYFHPGEHKGVNVLFQDARARNKSADRVEKALRQAGYTAPKRWDIKRKSG